MSNSYLKNRSAYQLPPFSIDSILLEFDLSPTDTLVRSTLSIRRNAIPSIRQENLILQGENIELIGLQIDGIALNSNQYEFTNSYLKILDPPNQFTLTTIGRIVPEGNNSLMGLYRSGGTYVTQCEPEGFRHITWFLDRPDVMARYTVTIRAPKIECPVLLSNGNLIASGECPPKMLMAATGNSLNTKDLQEKWHWATWVDPFPKPCYLFALVAGDLVAREELFITSSNRSVLLQVWSRACQLHQTAYALKSLKQAIMWDEKRFGLEIDLERFMIVAIDDFNSGAMENKGLNIFNTKYILAYTDTATDEDFADVESVVAHEYFHNWTGNRVTCRDWFQLTLKEGLTVFRDQEFSSDQLAERSECTKKDSAKAVKRIEDVRFLRTHQFAEDAGPMAHSIRPNYYRQISNFYTATVYEKGAEVVRMLQTMLGPEVFAKGLAFYISKNDGKAVTCDDFVEAISSVSETNLSIFTRWYSQVGTPVLRVKGQYDSVHQTYTIFVTQKKVYYSTVISESENKPVPVSSSKTLAEDRILDDLVSDSIAETHISSTQADALPLHIPMAIGLIGPDGRDIIFSMDNNGKDDVSEKMQSAAAGDPLGIKQEQCSKQGQYTQIIHLLNREERIVLYNVSVEPIPSLMRNFSAPVIVEFPYSLEDRAFMAKYDSDPFNRWEAARQLVMQYILDSLEIPTTPKAYLVEEQTCIKTSEVWSDIQREKRNAATTKTEVSNKRLDKQLLSDVFVHILTDISCAPAWTSQALQLPDEHFVAEQIEIVDPTAIRKALTDIRGYLANILPWKNRYQITATEGSCLPDDLSLAGYRALSGVCLSYWVAQTPSDEAEAVAQKQFDKASNMTERLNAIRALLLIGTPKRDYVLAELAKQFAQEPLVLDKWFSLQATMHRHSGDPPVLERVKKLCAHPAFSIKNPNRVRALIGSFCHNNLPEFHANDGSGYHFWVEQIIRIDAVNPHGAARLARSMDIWPRLTADRRFLAHEAIKEVAQQNISRDLREVLDKLLGANIY